MNTLSAKVILYDLLSMIIPGYLVLFLIIKAFLPDFTWCYDNVTFGVVAFAISSIVGLAIHWSAKLVFRSLRNCDCLVNKAKENVNKSHLRSDKPVTGDNVSYYDAYYFASRFAWSSVPVLEAQYSFLRSAIIVEVLYMLFGCKAFSCPYLLSVVAGLLIVTILLMLSVLRETHVRIWEDYAYIEQRRKSNGDDETY